jgi:hypothetical protein
MKPTFRSTCAIPSAGVLANDWRPCPTSTGSRPGLRGLSRVLFGLSKWKMGSSVNPQRNIIKHPHTIRCRAYVLGISY